MPSDPRLMMRSRRRLALACTTLLFTSLPLAAQTPRIIEPRVERVTGPPLWISAESVLDAEKIIDLDQIQSDHLRRFVERQRRDLGDQLVDSNMGRPDVSAIPQSECKFATASAELRGGWAPSATLADLKSYSRSIVRGTIRTIDPGFAFGIPELLLGVDISGTIKGATPQPPFYVNYPVAGFKIGPFRFCNGEKGFEPQPGDQILLFDYIGAVDRDGVLYVPRVDQIFFQRHEDGFLYLPPNLNRTPDLEKARSLDDVIGLVRSLDVPDKKAPLTDILDPDADLPQ